MKTRTLLTKLGRLYPKRIALKHNDYVGYMAGQKVEEVKRIVLLLDLDEIVLEEALSHKPDLILTHHPFIRGTRAKVFARDEKKKAFALWLDTLPVTVYSMHTNFDEAPNGMNDVLAEKLELSAVKPLASEPMARGGYLPYPMTVEESVSAVWGCRCCTKGTTPQAGCLDKTRLVGRWPDFDTSCCNHRPQET